MSLAEVPTDENAAVFRVSVPVKSASHRPDLREHGEHRTRYLEDR